jgi:hypothetical protein
MVAACMMVVAPGVMPAGQRCGCGEATQRQSGGEQRGEAADGPHHADQRQFLSHLAPFSAAAVVKPPLPGFRSDGFTRG